MYLLYLDDSGSAGNPQESHLVLAGICVFERQVHFVAQEIEKLASQYQPGEPASLEFHASEIFSGKIDPWKKLDRPDRKKVIVDMLSVLRNAHPSTQAFACAVHKASFPGKDPMEIAFEEVCSRFDIYLKRMYAERDDPQRGLIIVDKGSYETSLQRLAKDFRSIGTRWGVIVNLADVPLFVDSMASRLVQLADHIAYAVFRHYDSGDTSYLNVILPRFNVEAGKLHGLVHKVSRDEHCMCPACLCRMSEA